MNQPAALAKAIEALRNGDARASLRFCNGALAQMPGNVDALHLRGLALHKLGDQRAAAAAIGEAIHRAPRNPVLHGNLGRVWAAAGDMERAASSFAMAIRLAPNSAADHADLGNALIRLGRIDEGCAAFKRALELAPTNPRTRESLFSAYMLQAEEAALREQHQRAVNAYTLTLELKPDDHKALHGRATMLLAMGDPIRARDDARKLTEISPRDSEALMLLGEIERNAGNTVEAARAFDRMIAINQRDLRARWCRAALLPPIYDSEEQIAAERTQWHERMAAIEADLRLDGPDAVASAIEGLYSANNYNLHYQGYNDRPLQELYARLLHRVAAARYPQFAERPPRPETAGRRPRIGFVSQYLREHSVWKIQGALDHPLVRGHGEVRLLRGHDRRPVHAGYS